MCWNSLKIRSRVRNLVEARNAEALARLGESLEEEDFRWMAGACEKHAAEVSQTCAFLAARIRNEFLPRLLGDDAKVAN